MPRRVVRQSPPHKWLKTQASGSHRFFVSVLPSEYDLNVGTPEDWQKQFKLLRDHIQRVAGPNGSVLWVPPDRGIITGAQAAIQIQKALGAKYIVDPVCGDGVVLAVANAMGLDVFGVESDERLVTLARKVEIKL